MKNNQWDRIETMLESLCVAWSVPVPPRKRTYVRKGDVQKAPKPKIRNGVCVTRKRWTPKETLQLAKMVKQGHSLGFCAEALGRTTKACSVQHSRFLRGKA